MQEAIRDPCVRARFAGCGLDLFGACHADDASAERTPSLDSRLEVSQVGLEVVLSDRSESEVSCHFNETSPVMCTGITKKSVRTRLMLPEQRSNGQGQLSSVSRL